MIRAVFFDYDGVLTTDRSGSLTTTRYLSHATGLAPSVVEAALKPHNKALTLGLTTHARVWPQLCEALGQAVDIGLLRPAFESTPVNERMFALARRLKPHCAVGIITDNKKDRLDHLRLHQSLDALFDTIVVSAEIGFDKTGPEIFRLALERAGVRAEEAVFVDNTAANLVAPAALGFRTFFHDDARNDVDAVVDALRAWGMPLNEV